MTRFTEIDQYYKLNRKLERAVIEGTLTDTSKMIKKRGSPNETRLLDAILHSNSELLIVKSGIVIALRTGKAPVKKLLAFFNAIKRYE